MFPRPAYPTSYDPIAVTVADLDNDGNLDMIVGSNLGFELSIYFGDDGGGFAPPIVLDLEVCPASSLAHDFDADGNLDLAVANGCAWLGGGGIAVYPGNGDGTFGAPHGYGLSRATIIAGGDFNGDELLDLIGGNTVLLGDADGSFEEFTIGGSGAQWSVAVADLDGDGLDDVVFDSCVRLSNGDGTFADLGCLPVGENPQGVAVDDLDGDGIPDLVAANLDSNDISVLLGNGDGSFQPETRYPTGVPVETGRLQPWQVWIGDFEPDGLPDLLVSNWSTSPGNGLPPLTLFRGTGHGSFASAVETDPVGWGYAHDGKLVDLDGDGVRDLVRTSMPRDTVHWLFGDGAGGFKDNLYEDVEGTPGQTLADDLDADGRLDLIVATDRISVLMADGAASFASPAAICAVEPVPACPPESDPTGLATGELTGDAHLDIAVAVAGSYDVITILAGDGVGGFSASASLPIDDPGTVAVSDLNLDGNADLVGGGASAGLSVWLSNGDGTFQAKPSVPVGPGRKALSLADYNGDGLPDLAVAADGDGEVTVHMGNGDGTFAPTWTIAGNAPRGIASGEFTGDGILDLLLADGGVWLHPGEGDGTFESPQPSGLGGASLLVADIDGDGRDDAAVLADRGVVPAFGNGDGTFRIEERYVWVDGTGLNAGDLNLDGRLDLIGHSGNFVVVMPNLSGPASLVFADRETLIWPAATGAHRYDMYRGALSSFVDADDDGLPDGGYGACLGGSDENPRDTRLDDPAVPEPFGTGFFYLYSVFSANGDEGLGTTSAGMPRPRPPGCF